MAFKVKRLGKAGSIMAEASLIIPMVMILSAILINLTLSYYNDVRLYAQNHQAEWEQALDDGQVNNQECEFARRADIFLD